MISELYSTPRAVVSCFPAFAGGKFLSNCLALSQNCCPQDPEAAKVLLMDPANYQYRMQKVMSTLPPRHRRHQWRDFEFGDQQLYGEENVQAWQQGVRYPLNSITHQLCESDLYFFITNHAMDPTALLKVWPRATVLTMTNFRRFQDLCLAIKASDFVQHHASVNGNYCEEKYNVLAGPDWPLWQDFERSGYCVSRMTLRDDIQKEITTYYHGLSDHVRLITFDMDASIFDHDCFVAAMSKLYHDLSLSDFDEELVSRFYLAYINLHD